MVCHRRARSADLCSTDPIAKPRAVSPSCDRRNSAQWCDVSAPEATVVIPARDAQDLLRRCLECTAESVGCSYETVVVDDGSSDDTACVARELGARVIPLEQSVGPAAARNRGVDHARGDIIIFLDADVFVRPTTLSQLVETLRDSNCDAVFGSYDSTPSACNLVSQYKNLFHHHTHQQAHTEASTFWSGCGAVRRERFLHRTSGGLLFRRSWYRTF